MSKIIGIDLGTTNSAVAVMEGDKVRVIKPGIYDLSTDMTAAQMLEIMSTPAQQDTQEENTASEAEVEQSAEEDALSENILENPEMQGE